MTILPVFPLPEVVFFPDTVLPLHIFEQRYRDLIADVSAGDGTFVVSLMDGDDFCAIGTIGVVRDLNVLPDGRSTLRLHGETRVELTEMPSPHAYRLVSAVPRPEPEPPPTERLERARVDLAAWTSLLAGEIRVTGESPFSAALNAICSGLPIEAHLRQQLLEEDDLMRRHAIATSHLDAVIEAVMKLHNVSVDDSGPPELLN